MEVEIKQNICLYGRIQSREGGDDETQKDYLVVYIRPTIFGGVPLSSLEGFFICNDSHLGKAERLEESIPQVSFKRDGMEEFEKRYNGNFFPFKR